MRQLVNAVLDEELAKRLDDFRWAARKSRSEVMRDALIEFFEHRTPSAMPPAQPQPAQGAQPQ